MGAYVLLLYFDMAKGSDRLLCEKELIRRIHDNGDCLDTGFRHAVIAPKPCKRICSAERTFHSVNGQYRVQWDCKNDMFRINIEIPCNSTATVLLPDGTRYDVESGSYSYTCNVM